MGSNYGFNREILDQLDHYNLQSYENNDIRRRVLGAQRELRELTRRMKDVLKLKNPTIPADVPAPNHVELLQEFLIEVLQKNTKPELKTVVLRRMANKIGRQVLWTRITSIPVIHELIALGPWWICQLPLDVITGIRDVGLRYIMNGIVIPVQSVREELLSARSVYMGHCVCRSSGIVDDLKTNGRPFTILPRESNDVLLNRLVTTYLDLERDGALDGRSEKIRSLFQKLVQYQQDSSAEFSLETFFDSLYPHWEFIPVQENYTPNWIRSLYLNNKAFYVPPKLAVEIANALYYSRGIVFNSMKLIDTRYTICSCPTPENSGGCILTNWYYFAQANDSLIPNTHFFGQRKERGNKTGSCNVFPFRAGKQCLGCGCHHGLEKPRDLTLGIQHTEKLYNEFLKTL